MKKKIQLKRSGRVKKLIATVVAGMVGIGLIFNPNYNNDDNKVEAANSVPINGTIMQYFQWYLPNNGSLWGKLSSEAKDLANKGFTAVWLPPAYKNMNQNSVGYEPYDLYDLGEFNQKNSTRTKYGTLSQYTNAITACHNNGIDVYADVVLNHKSGADYSEKVSAYEVYNDNRLWKVTGNAVDINAWTKFTFPGRGTKYSSFKWDASCFDGVDDYGKVYLFANKSWDSNVSTENHNYDYLMGADIDFDNQSVVKELKSWGIWYTNKCNLDGFRLDAVKHIKSTFYSDWLNTVRSSTGKEMFTVGEYWSSDINALKNYLYETGYTMSLFDVPLHYNFKSAADSNGYYDLRYLFSNTLVSDNPVKAVTFVDNHDTQPGQSLQSSVGEWFKMLAYTAILTREGGYPCVFYGDYYGVSGSGTYLKAFKNEIDKVMYARKKCAYGTQHDYLDDPDTIGWTREGIGQVANSGLAALISDYNTGTATKRMYVGTSHKGEVWYDVTGNIGDKVTISNDGYGVFKVKNKSYSVWINEKAGGVTSGNSTGNTTGNSTGNTGGSTANTGNSTSNGANNTGNSNVNGSNNAGTSNGNSSVNNAGTQVGTTTQDNKNTEKSTTKEDKTTVDNSATKDSSTENTSETPADTTKNTNEAVTEDVTTVNTNEKETKNSGTVGKVVMSVVGVSVIVALIGVAIAKKNDIIAFIKGMTKK